eukprot:m.170716 g.170716  ORF g.170716 m.170716 type:complete len:189 (-) comp15276_c16_seq1:34-600(-)
MAACNDITLGTDNQNVLQTVTQIVELETAEIRKALLRARHDGPASTAAPVVKMDITNDEVPRGFVCPITLTLMKDPVTAADGHSYERKAIEAWLLTHSTSPVTNLALPHPHVVDNHALRQAIEDFVDSQKRKQEKEAAEKQAEAAAKDEKKADDGAKTAAKPSVTFSDPADAGPDTKRVTRQRRGRTS